MTGTRPTVAVTLGYDLPRNPGQLGVRGAILETLASAGASLRLVSALDHVPLDDDFFEGLHGLVLPGGERRVPDRLRGPEGGIAVRWTPHPGVTRLIQAYGDPITSTSANLPGVPPAMSATEILQQWSDAVTRGQIRVLDGGRLSPSDPSTVIDCTGQRPRVIRPGAIPATTLRESAPDLIGDV